MNSVKPQSPMGVPQALRILRRYPRYFLHLVGKNAKLAARYRWIQSWRGSNKPVPKPLVFKLMLNWSCNLRCPMCMLWGEVGWLKQEQDTSKKELPWEVVEKVFRADLSHWASFIFSGGEPLMYSRFGDLLRLQQKHRKFSVICTNGLWLDRYLEEIDGNPYPTWLISLDGSEEINNTLRGNGVHAKVIANLKQLQSLRKSPFIGIQFTVMPENVAHMEQFCEEMVALGVDWILLNPGWFISPEQASEYEQVLEQRFGVHPTTHEGYLREYNYDVQEFRSQLERIWSRKWPIQIASHLKRSDWVEDFIGQPGKILGSSTCYKQWIRIDVLPDGTVTPCAQFPDLIVGDLTRQELDEVWHSEENRRFQDFASHESLSVCAKCDALYLYTNGV